MGASETARPTDTHPLRYPIMVDGKRITEVTLRRPNAGDMIVIADALPVLSDMSVQVQAAMKEAGGDEEKIGLLVAKHMSAATFKAMITIASQLADLGDAAQTLDYADLSPIAMGALALMGE